jgi:hypothetical protein
MDGLLVFALLAALGGVIFQQYRLALMRLDRDHQAHRVMGLLRSASAARHEADQARAELAELRRAIKGQR